jgi:hypothetical protein
LPGIDLRLWGSAPGESLGRLKALLGGADMFVVVLNRVSHRAMEIVKVHAQRNQQQVIYWSRGVHELQNELAALIKNRSATKEQT